MIIKRIKTKNYKTYLSLDLDLSVKPDQPIILIGGMNGGGKTTLFEAICGALYGLKIKNKAHFQELLNNGAIGKVEPTIVLELTFEGMVLGRMQEYLLRRTYKLNPADKPVENVLLRMARLRHHSSAPSMSSRSTKSSRQIYRRNLANIFSSTPCSRANS